jgi:hypothetical protein
MTEEDNMKTIHFLVPLLTVFPAKYFLPSVALGRQIRNVLNTGLVDGFFLILYPGIQVSGILC